MASKNTHLAQAEHNQKLSNKLLTGVYYDWACTTAFYSALHYVEAKFFENPNIVHGHESFWKNKQRINEEDIRLGVHLWREFLLKGISAHDVRLSYRNLRETSEQVRYLENHDKVACDFINTETAKNLVKNDLPKIKKGLGFK